MSADEMDFRDFGLSQGVEQRVDDAHAVDGDHGLGDVVGERVQPGTKAGGQDDRLFDAIGGKGPQARLRNMPHPLGGRKNHVAGTQIV